MLIEYICVYLHREYEKHNFYTPSTHTQVIDILDMH